jgi:chemotaxis protein CheD
MRSEDAKRQKALAVGAARRIRDCAGRIASVIQRMLAPRFACVCAKFIALPSAMLLSSQAGPASAGERGVNSVASSRPVLTGDCELTADPQVSFQLVLGSCVSACVWDAKAGIGGVNHFLLPYADAASGRNALKLGGAFLMERLIESLVAEGATLGRLQARIFGGANLIGSAIGQRNAEFAIAFLRNRRIALASSDVGGHKGRWLRVWPAQGRVEVRLIEEPSQSPSVLIAART